MTTAKYFDIAGTRFHLELRTFTDAKPYRIVLVIRGPGKSVYFWYGKESILKIYGKYVDDIQYINKSSLAEYKVSILKFLTNS